MGKDPFSGTMAAIKQFGSLDVWKQMRGEAKVVYLSLGRGEDLGDRSCARPARRRPGVILSCVALLPSLRQNVDQNWSKCSETIFRKYSTVPSEA